MGNEWFGSQPMAQRVCSTATRKIWTGQAGATMAQERPRAVVGASESGRKAVRVLIWMSSRGQNGRCPQVVLKLDECTTAKYMIPTVQPNFVGQPGIFYCANLDPSRPNMQGKEGNARQNRTPRISVTAWSKLGNTPVQVQAFPGNRF
jgi:hypothetical protein